MHLLGFGSVGSEVVKKRQAAVRFVRGPGGFTNAVHAILHPEITGLDRRDSDKRSVPLNDAYQRKAPLPVHLKTPHT